MKIHISSLKWPKKKTLYRIIAKGPNEYYELQRKTLFGWKYVTLSYSKDKLREHLVELENPDYFEV